MTSFGFDAELWLWPGDAPWVFLTVPDDLSDEILDAAPRVGGFGALKVEVTIGSTIWETSLFPDSKRGAYVLPVKKQVRAAEEIDVGDSVRVSLSLVARR